MKQPSPHAPPHVSNYRLERTAIVCDFDDTTADRNVATLLLETFHTMGEQPWRETQQRFANAEISLAEYQEITFSQITASRDEQVAFARDHAALRPGFHELANFCESQGVALAIASHGLDYYVSGMLDHAGLSNVPVHAVQSDESPTGAMTFSYAFRRSGCAWFPGNCKCNVVDIYKTRGFRVLYAGDGASDACPARRADFVFARDRLLDVCRRERLRHLELTDFHIVLEYLREQHMEDA